MVGEYGVVANVLEADKVFRNGAKVWISGGTGGEGWYRFKWIGLSRGGRTLEKWAPTLRFENFRAAWIPDHLRDRIHYMRGGKDEMDRIALLLNEFVTKERKLHPNRRAADQPKLP